MNLRQIKKVRRKLRRVHRKITQNRIKIRLVSRTIFKSKYKNSAALNVGSILSPNRFMLLPRWFKRSKNKKAGVIVYMLFNDLFRNKKVDLRGTKITVSGNYTAKKLAIQNPKKARRSAVNYRDFCLALWKEE